MSETIDRSKRREASPPDHPEEPALTEHVEPLTQGGERYVRCTACGRELLCALGGRSWLFHSADCPFGGAER